MVISGASSRSLQLRPHFLSHSPFSKATFQQTNRLWTSRIHPPLVEVLDHYCSSSFVLFVDLIQLFERFTAHNKPAITVYKAGTALFKPNKSVRDRRNPCYNSIFMAQVLKVKHVEGGPEIRKKCEKFWQVRYGIIYRFNNSNWNSLVCFLFMESEIEVLFFFGSRRLILFPIRGAVVKSPVYGRIETRITNLSRGFTWDVKFEFYVVLHVSCS